MSRLTTSQEARDGTSSASEIHPVKELLFEYVKDSEERFSDMASSCKFDYIIDDLVSHCYDMASKAEDRAESLGVLATAILHYTLTCSTIPSQRKTNVGGVDVDIVVPGLKTLQKDAKKSLVLCMPDTLDRDAISARLAQLQRIQPERQNIWLVLSEDPGLDYKTYVMSKENGTFSRIIYDIAQFANVNGQDRLKILRV